MGCYGLGSLVVAERRVDRQEGRLDGLLGLGASLLGLGAVALGVAGQDGFQIIQGLFAMASGGITGTGLGMGGDTRIPAAENDFIFAVMVQELGLAGGAIVLIAYLLIVGSGLRIAQSTEVAFDKLLATGLTLLIGLQAFIILAGVIRLLPLTGVALPFISYGGSSLVMNYVLLAILLRISDQTAQRERNRSPVVIGAAA